MSAPSPNPTPGSETAELLHWCECKIGGDLPGPRLDDFTVAEWIKLRLTTGGAEGTSYHLAKMIGHVAGLNSALNERVFCGGDGERVSRAFITLGQTLIREAASASPIPAPGGAVTALPTHDEWRQICALLIRRILHIEPTLSQHREFADAICHRLKAAAPAQTTGRE